MSIAANPLAYSLLASAGLGIADSVIGGGGQQEISSFEGTGADPTARLNQAFGALEGVAPAFTELARRPVSIPGAIAQTPPSFTGGGIPVPIGVSGRDPALFDPSLLTLPGLDIGGLDGGGFPGSLPGGVPGGDGGSALTPDGFVPGADATPTGGIAVPRGTVPEMGSRSNPEADDFRQRRLPPPRTTPTEPPQNEAEDFRQRRRPPPRLDSAGGNFVSAPDVQEAMAAIELLTSDGMTEADDFRARRRP